MNEIESASLALRPPTVVQAEGGRLPSDSRADVNIVWPGLRLGDEITLSWYDWLGGVHELKRTVTSVETQTLVVPNIPYVVDNDGKDVVLSYRVAFSAGGAGFSEALTLHIGSGVTVDFEEVPLMTIPAGSRVTVGRGAATVQSSKDGLSIVDRSLAPYVTGHALAVVKPDEGNDTRGVVMKLLKPATGFSFGIATNNSVRVQAGDYGWIFPGSATGDWFEQSNIRMFSDFKVFTDSTDAMALYVDNIRFT